MKWDFEKFFENNQFLYEEFFLNFFFVFFGQMTHSIFWSDEILENEIQFSILASNTKKLRQQMGKNFFSFFSFSS